MLRQAQHERSATPAWAVPVLERSIDPEFVTYDLHLLRATIQLVRSIMERSGPGELVIWVDDEDQVPDWARRALERFLMTGQGFEGECAPFGRVGLERRKEARVRERPVVQGAPDRREGVGEPREGQQRPGRLEAAGARLLVPVCHRLDFRQERLGADRHGI